MARIHKSLKMTMDEVDELMSHEGRLRIASIGPGADINLTPMTFGWANGSAYIFGRGQKIANLRKNPTATILVDVGERWPELRGVMMRGSAVVLENEVEERADEHLKDAQFNLGSKHGLKERGEVQPYMATASGKSRRWIVFTPKTIVSWDNARLSQSLKGV